MVKLQQCPRPNVAKKLQRKGKYFIDFTGLGMKMMNANIYTEAVGSAITQLPLSPGDIECNFWDQIQSISKIYGD